MSNEAPVWKPRYDDAEAKALVGKRILVGLTRRNEKDEILGYEQFHGAIVRVSERDGIIVRVANSEEERWLPPDLSRIEPASPGEYRLKSSGEVVVDPDYLVTWTIYPRKRS